MQAKAPRTYVSCLIPRDEHEGLDATTIRNAAEA